MKTYSLYPSALLLIFALLFSSCKKDKLTKATQVGANTFSCKVNGVVYIPNDEAFSVRAISTSLSLNENNNYYDLRVLTNFSYKKPNFQINIILYKVKETGKYLLNGAEFRYGEYFITEVYGAEYDTKTRNIGEVNITKIDIVNKIVSGTFWFEATNKDDPNDKVSITDGRFDLRLR